MSLEERIDVFASALLKREAGHSDDLAKARIKADEVYKQVSTAMGRFNSAIESALPELQVEVTKPHLDEKHAHAIEFDLIRGRHRGIVIAKSKGEVTLVGPFKTGKNEGPCRTFPFSESAEIADALGDFLERFLEDATAP